MLPIPNSLGFDFVRRIPSSGSKWRKCNGHFVLWAVAYGSWPDNSGVKTGTGDGWHDVFRSSSASGNWRSDLTCKHRSMTLLRHTLSTYMLVWMELFEIFQSKSKNPCLSNWCVPFFMLYNIKRAWGEGCAGIGLICHLFPSEEQRWVGSHTLLGLDGCWITRFLKPCYWRGCTE